MTSEAALSYVDSRTDPLLTENGDEDHRTPLDKTIDRIGMGSYQWILLGLCGFGYLADFMWMQTNSIILPRVQRHFSIPDRLVGTMSSTMIGGMTVGALAWGALTDLMGRAAAFNATLLFTSIFGACAAFTNSFVGLCIVWFLVGSAIGGSAPTDGTLMLEHMPTGKEYLVVATGAYTSLGALVSALAGLIILPGHSCPPSPEPCERSENNGWRYLIFSLAAFTITMSILRVIFFRLYESPRYLVHSGRHEEAVEALRSISKYNGKQIEVRLEDVLDHHDETDGVPMDSLASSNDEGKSYIPLPTEDHDISFTKTRSRLRSRIPRLLQKTVVGPFRGWAGRIRTLLSRRWRRTTLLLWGMNCVINLAYAIFNTYLPKLLEERSLSEGETNLSDSLKSIVIYTLGGCPGSILAAYLANTKLGRRWSLAGSTAITAILSAAFIFARSPLAVNVTTASINLISTTMWAILYGWMPVLFTPDVRGTACGTSVALSRIAGMTAAALGGVLVSISNALAVGVSAGMYALAVILVLFMRETAYE